MQRYFSIELYNYFNVATTVSILASFCRDANKRNYELEDLKNQLKFKPAGQNPLRQMADEGTSGQKGMFQIDAHPVAKAQQVEEDEDKGGIAEKAKAVS